MMKRVMDGIPDMPIKLQDGTELRRKSFAQSAQVIGIPKKEWVGLTDEELEFYTEELGQGELGRGVLRAVDDFLKEKNA